MNNARPISSLDIARKLDAIKQIQFADVTAQFQDTPRVAKLLWFLHYLWQQPGSLSGWLAKFVAVNTASIGSDTMRELSKQTNWTAAQRRAVCEEMPVYPGSSMTSGFLLKFKLDYYGRDKEAHAADTDLAQFTRDYFVNGFAELAQERLATILQRWCNDPSNVLKAPWWFPNLIPALFAAMDAHAAAVEKTIARTAITEQVQDACNYAAKTRSLVHPQSPPRMGKTTACRALAQAQPWDFCLVNTPSSNTLADLWRAFAEALAIPFDHNTPARQIKTAVEYVIRHGGLTFILDESQFLIPQKYDATSAPERLNWIRTEIVDRRCGLVVVSTPQSYDGLLRKFVNKTGYTVEQWSGRKILTVKLPESLEAKDLLAVARHHFPAFDQLHLKLIVAKALQSESYLLAVESIARRAAYTAERESRAAVTFADVELAITEVVPSAPRQAPVVIAPEPAPMAVPVHRPRAAGRRNTAPMESPAPARFVSPESAILNLKS